MSAAYDKALESLQRGEEIRLRKRKSQGYDQHGLLVDSFETVVLFVARILIDGEEPPDSSRVISGGEADALSKLPGVIDERDQLAGSNL